MTMNAKNEWLLPWCFSCAVERFNFPNTKEGETFWNETAIEVRERTLAQKTMDIYERTLRRNVWPLDNPFKTIAYLNKAPASDSALRQWVAAAKRIHKARMWDPPPFHHPLVESVLEAIKRRPIKPKTIKATAQAFSREELQLLFNCLKQNKFPTDLRNWAIMVVQLFGVRRANEVLVLKQSDVEINKEGMSLKITATKTDKRKRGEVIRIPTKSNFGFNPAAILAKHVISLPNKGPFLFPNYDTDDKCFQGGRISLNAWNLVLKRTCRRVGIPIRTSHALRRSALTLTPIEAVEAVAQTGGWKSSCYWDIYRRFNLDDRTEACAQIGAKEQESKRRAMLIIKRD